jgi:predicted AlkP superfamily phosphohydrolase/phosphomutase
MRRLLILGLDSVPPAFVFDRYLDRMPNLKRILARSAYGTLRTIDPPITVPAWTVMFSGMDPGTLGLYGFRHRRPGSYHEMYTPNSRMLSYPSLWDLLSREGRRVAVIGMPPGYPPPKVNGVYVSDFLTPDGATDFVYPAALLPEVRAAAGGEYLFDVTFDAGDRDRVEREIFEMTRRRFAVARHLWTKERWDLFAMHEIGPDRIHHAFWKYFDRAHPKYIEDSPFNSIADRYYALIDAEIGRLLESVPEDVLLWIASDHGSKAMDGCFCINEWLIRNGYLVLDGPRPPPGTPLDAVPVDWSRTRVWGAGGYYARIFFNVRGRETKGIVDSADLRALVHTLRAELGRLVRPDGQTLGVELLEPSRIYRQVRGDPPDLMAYFGNLGWRSAGTVGHDSLYLDENDTGPDDSVHSMDGFFILHDPLDPRDGRRVPEQSILDVAPTLLKRLEMTVPTHMQGQPIPALLDERIERTTTYESSHR